jgi:PiT family inorganic phosphate transporter
MVSAWLITLPAAGLVGAAAFVVSDHLPGQSGVLVMLALLIALGALLWIKARKTNVHPGNVNAEWAGSVVPAEPAPSAAAA